MGTHLVFVDDDMQQFMSESGLSEFDDFLRLDGAELVCRRLGSSLRRLTLHRGGRGESVYVKSYDYTAMPLLRRFGAEKATREAANYLKMRDCGVGVPRLVGFGSRKRLGLLQSGFLITRTVTDCVGLEDWLARNQVAHRRRAIIAVSACLISNMHARGFFHIDLQFRNIMATTSESPQPVLLDSARGGYRYFPASRHHGRLRDLSSLFKDARKHFSRTEMLRWLRTYLAVSHLGPRDKLLIWTILRDRGTKDNPRE